jgi:hypothetical protein
MNLYLFVRAHRAAISPGSSPKMHRQGPSDELHRFSVEKILPRATRVCSTAEMMAALRPA